MWRSAALLAAAAPLLLAQGTVEGVVIDSITRAPIPGATVDLRAAGKSAHRAIAGASGAFRFADVPPGEYTPSFDADHYFVFQADSFRITSAGEAVHIQGELDPATKLTGHVLDPDGKPIPGVMVTTFTLTTRQGIMSFVTDKEGAFHPPNLQPGAYYLQARPNRGVNFPKNIKIQGSIPKQDEKRILAPTYYPGVADKSQATLIVASGGELNGYDIHLRSVPVFRIRGTVYDETGKPAAKVPLTIRTADLRFAESLTNPDAETVSAAGGTFEFADVAPGNWRIAAEWKRDSVELRGFTVATVTRHDEEDITIRLAAPFPIDGTTQPEANLKGVYLMPEDGPSRYDSHADVDDEGLFHFKSVYPGRYRISPSSVTGAYLAEVRLGEQDVTGQPVDLTAGSPPIRLVYRFDTGSARGSVENGAHAIVVLFPDRSGDTPAIVRCSYEGKFEIQDLRPGDYSAMAFNRIERDFVIDPVFAQRFSGRGVSVRVEPSRTASVELPLTVWAQ